MLEHKQSAGFACRCVLRHSFTLLHQTIDCLPGFPEVHWCSASRETEACRQHCLEHQHAWAGLHSVMHCMQAFKVSAAGITKEYFQSEDASDAALSLTDLDESQLHDVFVKQVCMPTHFAPVCPFMVCMGQRSLS